MSSPSLLRSSIWNIAGLVLPLVVAVVSLPLLIRLIGLERFGFLSLAWVLIGYASVFDLGLGRALIRSIALRLSAGDIPGAHRLAGAGLVVLAVLGLALGAAIVATASMLPSGVLDLPDTLAAEAVPALQLLALSLPFVMLTTGYQAVFTAHHRFAGLNLLRMALGVASYGLPVAIAATVGPRLEGLIASIVLLRVVGLVAHGVVAQRDCGFRWRPARPSRNDLHELFSVGGWIAISNVVSPALTYLDRVLISGLVPVKAIAFYAVPYDFLARCMLVPHAVMSALFPTASTVVPGTPAAATMLADAIRRMFVLMFPLTLVVCGLGGPVMHHWLGAEFGRLGGPIAQILAVGFLANALAQGPATLIQATGKPRWLAQLHLAELPLFCALLWLFTSQHGVVGTAAAALLRFGVDAFVVVLLARRCVGANGWREWVSAAPPAVVTAVLVGAVVPQRSLADAVGWTLLACALFAVYAWVSLLTPGERATMSRAAHALRAAKPVRRT